MKIKNKNIAFIWLFSAFVFVQFVILRMGNQAGRGFLPERQQELVYMFIQIAVILGYFAHALLYRVIRSDGFYRVLSSCTVCLCLISSMLMLFCPIDSLFYLIVSAVGIFPIGYIGSAVYVRLSFLTRSVRRAGVCVGVGYSVAVSLQFFFQLQWTVTPALAVLLSLAFISLALLLPKGRESANIFSEEEREPAPRSALLSNAVIVFALMTFSGYYNSYIHHLQIMSGYTDYNVYSWPRLLMIPPIILIGLIGDLRGGRFLPVSTLCVVVISLLNTALLTRETYLLNMCLFYVSLTSVVAYYHLTFLRLAPSTKHPVFWASFGRVIDSAVVIFSFLFRFSALSQVTVLVIDIAALAVVIVTMALSGAFNLSAPAAERAPAEPAPAPDPFPDIRERYSVTPSELKVLRELVLTDDKQDVIAARLNISVSTLRHHVTSIYKKTGVQTRAALCKLVIDK